MAEHATRHEVLTCAEHAEIVTGKPLLSCNECGSLFQRINGGWVRYRPEEWVTEQIATAVAQGGQAFPVGSVFTSVVATNPATLLGYGTWQALGAGRMLVGFDSNDADFDTLEEMGGAKTVTLTEAQMPVHTHLQNPHSHAVTSQTATTGAATSYEHGTLDTSSAETEATETTAMATAVNQNAGSGQAHNNLSPYLVVRFWKRTE